MVQEPGTGGVGASPRKDPQSTVSRLQSERDRPINELKHAKKKYPKDDDRRGGVDLKPNDEWKKESGGGKKRRRGG